jgi:hypothetical protein
VADQVHRHSEADLKDHGVVVASFRDAVMAGEHGLGQVPGFIKKILVTGAWRERIERGKPLTNETFLEFITGKPMKGCAFKPEQIEALIHDEPVTLVMWQRATGGQGARNDLSEHPYNVRKSGGNAKAVLVERLERERPDLFQLVVNRKLSANAAAIEAGFRSKLNRFEQIVRWVPKLTDDERRQLRAMLGRDDA